jgi:HlyD family secretion protein
MKKILLPISLVIIIIVIVSFSKKSTEIETTGEKKIIKTSTVQLGSIRDIREFSGIVQGEQETILYPKISGYITKSYKKEGDLVAKGDILAIIDGSELYAQSNAAAESVKSIEKTLEESEDYYKQLVDESESALDRVEEEYKSVKDSDESTDSQKDIAKKSLKQAEESVKSAKRLRDLQIQSATGQLTTAQGQLSIAQSYSKNTQIVAPYSGIITSKLSDVGALVSPGMPVLTLAKSENKELTISVSSIISRELNVDDDVRIISEFIDQEIGGKISSISPLVDQVSRKAQIKIIIDNSELHLGDFVSVFFILNETSDVVKIPLSAIVREYHDNSVFVYKNGVANKQIIEIGKIDNEFVEILSGISQGDELIIEGQFYLQDGDDVRKNN